VIAEGSPECVAGVDRSYTGKFLQKILPQPQEKAA
jgi:excinuclease UvrABC ATPase subunit